MQKRLSFETIDQYIASFPQATQEALTVIRKLIQTEVPVATETISYNIPTFKLKQNLIHFAGYEKHIGLYPGAATIEALQEQLIDYKTSKGAIQFPLDKPLPINLIKRIIGYRVNLIR